MHISNRTVKTAMTGIGFPGICAIACLSKAASNVLVFERSAFTSSVACKVSIEDKWVTSNFCAGHPTVFGLGTPLFSAPQWSWLSNYRNTWRRYERKIRSLISRIQQDNHPTL